MPENPLAALGPIAWDTLDASDLDAFLGDTFACAQIIADSVPTVAAAPTTGRPRSQTDGAVSYGKIWGWGAAPTTTDGPPAATHTTEKKLNDLRQSWKEVKPGGANPRDVAVYKMNGGREGYAGSSWFARRSLHKDAIDFDTFKRGLLHEFDLSVPRDEKTKPVRTMVTKKCLEHVPSPEKDLQVFLLEADFPGPTASRDFVTMLLTAESTLSGPKGPCKQFMMVSKPCEHPATPVRSGFVRAQYESVEMIRQVPVPKEHSLASTGRRTRSSVDLGERDGHFSEETHDMAIEWIMITRNNPGGNVPRFLVDKSTPSSIVSDANKFLDWLAAKEWVDGTGVQVADVLEADKGEKAAQVVQAAKERGQAPDTATSLGGMGAVMSKDEATSTPTTTSTDDIPSIRGGAASSTRLFNMIAGLGGTAVVSKLPNPFETAAQVIYPVDVVEEKEESDLSDDDLDSDSDSDSTDGDSYSDQSESGDRAADTFHKDDSVPVRSRASTLNSDGGVSAAAASAAVTVTAVAGVGALSIGSSGKPDTLDNDSKSTSSSKASSADKANGSEKTDTTEKKSAAQKLLEKHNRAIARREAQFQKELQKLEQKRQQQADKDAARQRKAAERESKGSKGGKEKEKKEKKVTQKQKEKGLLEYTQRELERAAVQIEALREEVRTLQAENQRLRGV